jgi:hypothetical protein
LQLCKLFFLQNQKFAFFVANLRRFDHVERVISRSNTPQAVLTVLAPLFAFLVANAIASRNVVA